ncbi:MAG TPA: ABC transporter substrate-binding protein, partial [Nocardioidaceae bacterium]|nr:ABC transporter substrate-binding protein [Nocardioidaceae bacterium]
MTSTVRIRRIAVVLGAALLAASTLAACGDDTDDAQPTDSEPAGGAFPVTIEHTFGETTIEQKPERIVTLGWNAQDVVYALGHTPVGMPSDDYGVTDQHVKPWLTEYFDPDETTLLDTTDGPPMEKIAALEPDVILAPYEGFDNKTYEMLSAIAPTVAYPGEPWQTTWQKQTTMIGEALGQSADAKDLIDEVDTLTDKVAGEHPEFEGKTVSVMSLGAENYVYMPADPRVQ